MFHPLNEMWSTVVLDPTDFYCLDKNNRKKNIQNVLKRSKSVKFGTT